MAGPRATVVWIDARAATILRGGADAPALVRLASDVPPHRRSTGHVTAPGGERHGGTGEHAAGESHRLEHLRAFLAEVRRELPPDDLLLLGEGTVVERLAALLREDDVAHARERRVEVRRRSPLSDAQLRAALRAFVGEPAPRGLPGT